MNPRKSSFAFDPLIQAPAPQLQNSSDHLSPLKIHSTTSPLPDDGNPLLFGFDCSVYRRKGHEIATQPWVERKDKTGYADENLPEDLRIQMDTFFENARLMADYKLDTIPGEVLANLTKVMAKYPQYQQLAQEINMMVLQDEMDNNNKL